MTDYCCLCKTKISLHISHFGAFPVFIMTFYVYIACLLVFRRFFHSPAIYMMLSKPLMKDRAYCTAHGRKMFLFL